MNKRIMILTAWSIHHTRDDYKWPSFDCYFAHGIKNALILQGDNRHWFEIIEPWLDRDDPHRGEIF